MVKRIMEGLGWVHELHYILGTKRVRYHKDCFELSEELAIELLNAKPGVSYTDFVPS